MAEVLVRQLFRETEQYADSEVTVRGWIRTNRGSNKFGFVELNDGSFFKSVQVVYEADFLDNYAEMASLFDSALDKAQDGETRRHVEEASVHAHFLGLSATYERDYLNGDDAARAAYAERYAWLWNYYKDNAYDGNTNPNGIRGTVFGSGTANFEAFPKSAQDVVCPMDWIFAGGFDGHAGAWVFPFGLPDN